MAELARTVAAPRSVEDVLGDVTAAAKELIPGVDTAGCSAHRQGRQVRLARRHIRPAARLDELQMKYSEGPCVQAALDDLIVRTDDFRTERAVAAVLAGGRRARRAQRRVVQAVHRLTDRRVR